MSKICYIMRGLPGSGKSEIARSLAISDVETIIHSTDDFFDKENYKEDCTYEKCVENHHKNFEAFKKS